MFSCRKANAPPACYDYYCPNPEKKHWLDYAIFCFVVATATATSFAACYTRQQWLTMQDTELKQLRAIITEEIKIEPFNEGGVRVVPIFKNSGGTQTEGLWAASMTSPIVTPNGGIFYPEPPNIASAPRNYFWLGPQQQFRVDGMPGVFDKSIVDEYHARSVQLIFRTLVQYRDIFEGTRLHTQRFCFAIWQNRVLFGDAHWTYSQCGNHQNCADEECQE